MPDALPRVAVLLSTYNGERYLEAQLASLAAQEGVWCDLFVRDDGSKDRTLEILAQHAQRWPQLAAPLTGPNLGPAMSFLELLKSVPDDFDYYAFCDQDDVWLPSKLARAIEHFVYKCTPTLYCAQVMCVDEALQPIGTPVKNDDTSFEHLLFENIAYGITVVMDPHARALIASRIPSRNIVMHDWWCALVVAALGRVVYDPLATVLYRQHDGNVIGVRPGRWSELGRRLSYYWSIRRRIYPIHGQATELMNRFGEALPHNARNAVQVLISSKSSLGARIRFAFVGSISRKRWIDELSARVLILAGYY